MAWYKRHGSRYTLRRISNFFTKYATDYHWLALVGGILADIGTGIETGGTLIFGVIPIVQNVADQLRNGVVANQQANYFLAVQNLFLNPGQIGDIENQIGHGVPRLHLE